MSLSGVAFESLAGIRAFHFHLEQLHRGAELDLRMAGFFSSANQAFCFEKCLVAGMGNLISSGGGGLIFRGNPKHTGKKIENARKQTE